MFSILTFTIYVWSYKMLQVYLRIEYLIKQHKLVPAQTRPWDRKVVPWVLRCNKEDSSPPVATTLFMKLLPKMQIFKGTCCFSLSPNRYTRSVLVNVQSPSLTLSKTVLLTRILLFTVKTRRII